MNCEVCGLAARTQQLIRYIMSVGDRLLVVEHVPAEVCPACGEITLQPDVVERLQQTIAREGGEARRIEVPVYEFAQ